ncbi:hypothetical protein CFP56_007926 [Quercus suber]|uniref:Uncharacterized protein n=1 Tax=Quercus suber TaxID=58331 RepID=A0AAW0ICT8_QUESU
MNLGGERYSESGRVLWRAILASPGDGELLSLYGRLIWETQRDGDRAKSYFDQAVYAPLMTGTFMWEAEEEEEDENEESKDISGSSRSPALVAGFEDVYQ